MRNIEKDPAGEVSGYICSRSVATNKQRVTKRSLVEASLSADRFACNYNAYVAIILSSHTEDTRARINKQLGRIKQRSSGSVAARGVMSIYVYIYMYGVCTQPLSSS